MSLTAADRREIRAVIDAYALHYDLKDQEGVLRCFTDDVHLDYLNGLKVLDGIAAVRASMFRFGAVPLPGVTEILHSRHQMRLERLTEHAAIDGVTSAMSRTSCIAHLLVAGDEGHSLLIREIRYDDLHRKTDAGWRISSRTHVGLWESRQPASRLD